MSTDGDLPILRDRPGRVALLTAGLALAFCLASPVTLAIGSWNYLAHSPGGEWRRLEAWDALMFVLGGIGLGRLAALALGRWITGRRHRAPRPDRVDSPRLIAGQPANGTAGGPVTPTSTA